MQLLLILGIVLGISLGINIAMFLLAFLLRTDKFTDISYAVTFMVIIAAGLFWGGISIPPLILAFVVFLWAARLGGYLLIRIAKIGKDSRFDERREHFWRFLAFWLLQGLSVWVILIPSMLFLVGAPESVPVWSFVGLLVFALGLGVEAAADGQKYRFINNLENKGKWIESGLWRYSRHPNYFGEICVWVGIYIFTLGGLIDLSGLFGFPALLGAVSPIYITLLLLFVSGVPILEKKADEKWGDDPAYQKYKHTTSILIPLPRKKL